MSRAGGADFICDACRRDGRRKYRQQKEIYYCSNVWLFITADVCLEYGPDERRGKENPAATWQEIGTFCLFVYKIEEKKQAVS